MLAMFLAALDQTIVATAMPTIGRELRDIEHLPWVASAYLLSATAVTPLYGKLSDIHGRRSILLLGIGIFILGSVACALASSMLVLIFARGLQGLGGGGLISLAQTIIADVVAPRERARYQGWIASVFVASSVAGPVLGGFFAEHLHWSMIFWINLPLGLFAFWMTGNALRNLPRHERPHRLDLIGAVLIVLASVGLMLALTWGGTRYPTRPPSSCCSRAPRWPPSCSSPGSSPLRSPCCRSPFSSIRSSAAARAACFIMGTFIGLSIYLPAYLGWCSGTASRTGLALIPFMGGVVTGATLAGRLMGQLRHYKPVIGLILALAGLAAGRFPTSLSLLQVELIFVVVGVGMGPAPVTTGHQNAVGAPDGHRHRHHELLPLPGRGRRGPLRGDRPGWDHHARRQSGAPRDRRSRRCLSAPFRRQRGRRARPGRAAHHGRAAAAHARRSAALGFEALPPERPDARKTEGATCAFDMRAAPPDPPRAKGEGSWASSGSGFSVRPRSRARRSFRR
ncbi:MAG: MFS transporter [Geminicoccaceae bacterium]